MSAAHKIRASSGEQIAPGARVGKYEVVHRIASGGMAEIYLARASGIHGFEKYVVLKRILPQYAANEEFVRMFLKEARVAASLDHANIAHVYDIGEAAGDTFFTMEYLHGEDVRHIVRHLRRDEQQLPLEHALEIVIGAASGLHFAHEKRGTDGRSLGIVHRDVSPANIVVTYDGGVKLVDFGIAKLATDPELSQRYTLKGKIAYMSPEQIHNEPVDRRSDVFALGIVLYELTTHTRLFRGTDEVQTIKAVLDGVVPPPTTHVPAYPLALERIVLRALARAPGDRYQSARDLQMDLEAFVADERVRVSAAGLAEWMEGTFGSKQEIWHTLAALPSRAPAAPAGPHEHTAVTKVSQPDAQALRATGAPGLSVATDTSPPAPRPRGRSWMGVMIALALVAAGGSFWLARPDIGLRAAPPAAPEPVVLIAEQGQVAVEKSAAPGPAAPAPLPAGMPPGAPAPAANAPASAPPPTPAVAPQTKTSSGGAARGRSFSAIFARRESDIRRCFLDHPGTSANTEISMRFDVQRDGHVSSVAVLPAAVASAPLGACLARVGKSTVFSKQTAPLSFRIPLTVQLETAGKSGP